LISSLNFVLAYSGCYLVGTIVVFVICVILHCFVVTWDFC